DEYTAFYKQIAHDAAAPARVIHYTAEGAQEFKVRLFIPAKKPFAFRWDETEYGLRLYVQRVLIMEHCQELLPPYLRFVKGVVDSADLPLNVSRQRLQEDRHIAQIRKWLTKKVLDSLEEMQKNENDKYIEMWKQFGPVLKEGITDFD